MDKARGEAEKKCDGGGPILGVKGTHFVECIFDEPAAGQAEVHLLGVERDGLPAGRHIPRDKGCAGEPGQDRFRL